MKNYLAKKIKGFQKIEKIRGEASTRAFFRVHYKKYTLVAMVYPEEKGAEINHLVRLTRLYLDHDILVPEIGDILDNRIVLQQDKGDLLLQRAFKKSNRHEKRELLKKSAALLGRLRGMDAAYGSGILGHPRMKWEMDFFIEHFAANFFPSAVDLEKLRQHLHAMVEKIEDINHFAHRDYHSRNMLLHEGEICLVDFQDSLQAGPYYDLVSSAFDSYLDLGGLRDFYFREFVEIAGPIDLDQLYLSALQRNIKALGTFGYQAAVRKKLSYKKYIPRTLRHIKNNPFFGEFPGKLFPIAKLQERRR